jgi:hypothetical protein
MKLLRTKVWYWYDVVLLKWSVLLFGMIVGAYFRECVMRYVWVVLVVAILLAVRPTITYWKDH